jgi:LmbE family N-acetylglucosaminyl deacetylase
MADLGRRFREMEGGPEPAGRAGDGDSGEEGIPIEWGTPDELVTTFVDVSSVTDRKYDSLRCHASQSDNAMFLRMGRETFGQVMSRECFLRASDRSGAAIPEDDLFAGLR